MSQSFFMEIFVAKVTFVARETLPAMVSIISAITELVIACSYGELHSHVILEETQTI